VAANVVDVDELRDGNALRCFEYAAFARGVQLVVAIGQYQYARAN